MLSWLFAFTRFTFFSRVVWSLGMGLLLLVPPQLGMATAMNLLGNATAVSDQVTADILLHAPQGIEPGAPVWAALRLKHAQGWHSYWKNPGDSGLPTSLNWSLPPGVQAGEVDWPTPKKFPLGSLANFGYDGTVMLVVPLHIGHDFSSSSFNLELNATWLACRTECIPEDGHFSLRLPSHLPQSADGRAFEDASQRLPLKAPSSALRLQVDGPFLDMVWSGATTEWRGHTLEFFPESPGLVDPGAPWSQNWKGSTWSARVPLSALRTEAPSHLNLVLAKGNVPHGEPAQRGVAFEVAVNGVWPAVQAAPAAAISDALQAALNANVATSAGSGQSLGIWGALLGALVGGLILNLMPCVFPVLAIKVLAFTQHADDRVDHRKAGVAYTLGVVASFACLGALLLSLRAAGEQLGWGFQLQSPAVVAGLATLFTLIALNLMGVFEVSSFLPSSVATFQAESPTIDAFLTGMLTTAIASPCTAPFMGASLGLAISLPTFQALAVFTALGLGMALPYLAASWIPAVARALPKPGAWMNTFKQLMAFPMWVTVVWLLWVLGQQSGIDGAATLMLALVVLSGWVWAMGLVGNGSRRVLSTLAATALVWWLWSMGAHIMQMPVGEATQPNDPPSAQASTWQPWTPERQASLLAEGRSVFVDYTAAWCVTCQYNKRSALADPEVLNHLKAERVVLLRADWTKRDPAVTQALSALGRNGVPTYAFHAPGQNPVVLPEILSANDLKYLVTR